MAKRESSLSQQGDAAPFDDAAPVPEDIQVVFGRNLRAARSAQGLTQQELGDRAGFKNQYVSRVEDGQINLTINTMKRLAEALGQDMRALLGTPAPNPNTSQPDS